MFWTFKIEPEQLYVMKIRNPVHITNASIYYINQTDSTVSLSSTVSLYIKHQGQYNQICTFAEVECKFYDIVKLDLKFDSKDDEVEIFLDGLNCVVHLSGSETPYHISHLNVITMTRKLESKDFEHIAARYPKKLSKRKSED